MVQRFEPDLAYPVLATVLLAVLLGTGVINRLQALPFLALAMAACIPYSLRRRRGQQVAWTALPIVAVALTAIGYAFVLSRLPATSEVAFAPVGVALGLWILPLLEPRRKRLPDDIQQP